MGKPMIPYPFFNMVDRMKEGERRYGNRPELTNSVFHCPECDGVLNEDIFHSGTWGTQYKCAVHGVISHEKISDKDNGL